MKNHRVMYSKSKILYDFVACLLIIVSHFANYIIYAEYSRFFPDIALVVGILCSVAFVLTMLLQIPSSIFRAAVFAMLISIVLGDAVFEYGTVDLSIRLAAMSATLLIAVALAFFLREHTNKVLIGAFLAMLFSTLVIGNLESEGQDGPVAATPRTLGDDPPIILHLILDEHMGLGGMTSRLPGGEVIRDELRDFYTRAGFRLFSHAYSQYFKTPSSLASALNFDSTEDPDTHLVKKRYGFAIDRNTYLEKISNRKYNMKLYQSGYFDFCRNLEMKTNKCVVYKPDNIDELAIKSLSVFERVKFIINMYYSSLALIKVVKLLAEPINLWLSQRDILLPRLGLWHGRVGPIAIAPILRRIKRDIALAESGTLFFAHLLTPHYPYVYTPTCEVRSPISSWSLRLRSDGGNSDASRRQRYVEYFDQIRCTMRELEALFDVMKRNGTYERAVIVVHGDHGSRINVVEPNAANASKMTADDYIDGYSTLFALKAPGLTPGVDSRMLPLSRLLAFALGRDERFLSDPARATVYLPDGSGGRIEVPLPSFPAQLD
ncbi:MAG: hypothetical protein GKS00_18575 [Alphaproteobacteria bacterium]|nr:hypothetical protein [Alphaproteobacteria bacterium]